MKRLLSRLRKARPDIESELAKRRRESSFPYISGDTFRSLSDVVVDEAGVSTQEWTDLRSIFCATKYAVKVLDLLVDPVRRQAARSMVLIVHNGDTPPHAAVFAQLIPFFDSVYSVNVTNELENLGVQGLPIGLENLHWKNHGKIDKYSAREEVTLSVSWDRPNLILSSFSVHTNQPVRSALMELLKSSQLPRLETLGDGSAYEKGLRSSVFVLSPQGNGLDCHRTWEALYSGAIPVVTRGTLSETLTNELPILVTPDWATFLGSSEEELREAAKTLGAMSLESAYMPYWIDKLELRK